MIEIAINNLFKNNAKLKAIVGDKVYPILADEDVVLPYITFQLLSAPRSHDLQGSAETVHARFQINCFCKQYLDAISLRALIKKEFDNYAGVEPVSTVDIECIHFENEGDVLDFTPGIDKTKKFGKRIEMKVSFIEQE